MPAAPDRPRFEFPAAAVLGGLKEHSPLILLESSLASPDEHRSFVFLDPLEVVRTDEPGEVGRCLERLDQAWKEGLWTAGYLAYEAGYALEPALGGRERQGAPLLWWGIYREPYVFDHRTGTFTPHLPLPDSTREEPFPFGIAPDGFSIDEKSYEKSVNIIHDLIAAGETYQVNFTMKYRFRLDGRPEGLYLSFRDNQPVPYGAFIRDGDRCVLSASPELFIKKEGREIVARPMKGTCRRGRGEEEDRLLADGLARDPKNRAENVMIVDLLRNDLGRICRPGSVETGDMFRIEPYDTLLQMTSTVKGSLAEEISLREMLTALFPCGSVTGAPKISTMGIIADLERENRGVFCGALGLLGPGGQAALSVPIRTAVIRGQKGEMGVGSGIVADSDPGDEYRECLLKAEFLTHRRPPLGLIETLRWSREEGFFSLAGHLARMDASARFFGIPFRPAAARSLLLEKTGAFTDSPLLVRLFLSRAGSLEVTTRPLAPPRLSPAPVCLSEQAVDSHDPFLYHKTTRRERYEVEIAKARSGGFFEVLFANERGELTEGSFTNLFLEQGDALVTPPLSSGLLNGILRQSLLQNRDVNVVEKVLFPSDITGANRFFVGNDARGLIEVVLRPGGRSLHGVKDLE